MYIATRIVGMLPIKLQKYAKAVIPAGAAAVTVIITYATTGSFDMDAMKAAGGMASAAVLAFVFPNFGYRA